MIGGWAVGNLTGDPELKTIPNGQQVCEFTVASDTKRGDQKNSSFLRCKAWGKQGEVIARFFGKGGMIHVYGELEERHWKDREGNKRSVWEMSCQGFSFVGDSGKENSPRRESKQEEAKWDEDPF